MSQTFPVLTAGVLGATAVLFVAPAAQAQQVDVHLEAIDAMSGYNVAAWWSPIIHDPSDGATYVTYLKANPNSSKDDVWVARRDAEGKWTGGATGFLSTHDAGHTQSSLAMDGDGYIHLFFAMHNGAVKYARADAPRSATGFTQSSPAAFEGGDYTYPNMTSTPDGSVWVIIRDKPHGGLFHYDPSSQAWTRVSNFASQQHTTVYPDQIVAGPEGDLHIIWEWAAGGAQASRHYGSYARFDPEAGSFHRADGSAVAAPLTVASADIYQPLEGDEKFMPNVHGVQSAKMALDDEGRPVIAYSYSTDNTAAGYQLRLARWTGSAWERSVVEPGPFDLDKAWIASSDGVVRYYSTLSPTHPAHSGSDDIFVRTSTDGGQTWSDPVAVTHGLDIQRPVGVTVDGVDYLYLPDVREKKLYLATVQTRPAR